MYNQKDNKIMKNLIIAALLAVIKTEDVEPLCVSCDAVKREAAAKEARDILLTKEAIKAPICNPLPKVNELKCTNYNKLAV